MYEYKYVDQGTGGGFFSGGRAHREVIDQCAREGWEYVGFFPTAFTSHGGISSVDLIFRRETPEV